MLTLSATAAVGGVRTEHDADVDFSQYHSFAWQQGTPVPIPWTHDRIVSELEQQLRAKGLEELAPGSADLDAYYHASVKEEFRIEDWG